MEDFWKNIQKILQKFWENDKTYCKKNLEKFEKNFDEIKKKIWIIQKQFYRYSEKPVAYIEVNFKKIFSCLERGLNSVPKERL